MFADDCLVDPPNVRRELPAAKDCLVPPLLKQTKTNLANGMLSSNQPRVIVAVAIPLTSTGTGAPHIIGPEIIFAISTT